MRPPSSAGPKGGKKKPITSAKRQPKRHNSKEEFEAFVKSQYVILAQPALSEEGFKTLMEHLSSFGYQKKKDRGTGQSTVVDVLAAGDDDLGSFLDEIAAAVEAFGEMINYFININRGVNTEDLYHTDNATEGKKGARNKGRLLAYLMSEGRTAGLKVISPPPQPPTHHCLLTILAHHLQHLHSLHRPNLTGTRRRLRMRDQGGEGLDALREQRPLRVLRARARR